MGVGVQKEERKIGGNQLVPCLIYGGINNTHTDMDMDMDKGMGYRK
jgi:hypothetical protein